MLNLPKTCSDQEIRERYRQLSIIFHPDKQVDQRRKEAATQRFLEVQKAYEGAGSVYNCSSSVFSPPSPHAVLSDPVTRYVHRFGRVSP